MATLYEALAGRASALTLCDYGERASPHVAEAVWISVVVSVYWQHASTVKLCVLDF